MTFLQERSLVDTLMMFAYQGLSIKTRAFLWCYAIEKRNPEGHYEGRYIPETRSILFNGVPSPMVVFHEAVHYKQHEDSGLSGAAFTRAYEGLSRGEEVALRPVARYEDALDESLISWMAYRNNAYEVEAREKARELDVAYRMRSTGPGCQWTELPPRAFYT